MKILALIVCAALAGCAYMVPSIGGGHRSNPNAGIGSPNPDRPELSCNFLAGGVTIEMGDTDLHLWLGGQDCNNMDPEPEVTIFLLHKFKKGRPPARP